jgi:hypothetical protein
MSPQLFAEKADFVAGLAEESRERVNAGSF